MSGSIFVLYTPECEGWNLLGAFDTEAEAEAERDRLGGLIERGCQLVGEGPYSADVPPLIAEVPLGRVDYDAWVDPHYYVAAALIRAGEWPGRRRCGCGCNEEIPAHLRGTAKQ